MSDKLAKEGAPLKKGHKRLRQAPMPALSTVAWSVIDEQSQLHLSRGEAYDFKFMLDAQSHYTRARMERLKGYEELSAASSAVASTERLQALAMLINSRKPWRGVN